MKSKIRMLKNRLISIHSSVLPTDLINDRRKTVLFYVSFYFVLLSVFFTILSQLPFFTVRGITKVLQVGWVFTIVPLIMLDYKRFIKIGLVAVLFALPFIVYCFVSIFFKIQSIQYGGTKCIFLCLYLFVVFSVFSKYKNKVSTKLICFSYLVATIIYAISVFFIYLIGYDLSNQIYAFGDKNSAGPIFMSAAIISFYLFDKKNLFSNIVKWSIFSFFVIIIALSKTRTVLITIPIIFFYFLFKNIKNTRISLIAFCVFVLAIILVFAIPILRETIIVNIFLNGKTDLDSITSGRISQIIENMHMFKPFLGTGDSYFDCMILSFLCTYGVFGFVSMLPLMILPFYILFHFRNKCSNKSLREILLALCIVFITSSILEGFGFFGTGAKVFILWFFAGNYLTDVEIDFKDTRLFNKTNLIRHRIETLPKPLILFLINTVLLVVSFVAMSAKSITLDVGYTIVDKLPSSNIVAKYVEVEDIQIDPPVQSMCVGQKITYGVKSTPINAEDVSVKWSPGWIQNPCISVDEYTGEVTAERTGNALLHINRFRVGPNGVYIQYPVVSVEDYVFDKLYISTKEFKKSFDYTQNENITIKQGCTFKIFFDNFYLPNQSLIEFQTTDTSIAVVENNNLIRAKNPGEVIINAIVHGKEETTSLNNITVNVESDSFVPTTNISLDNTDSIYQYQPFRLIANFNEGASDKHFSYRITDLEFDADNGCITFLNNGKGIIEIFSDNDQSINAIYNIEVLPNAPSHFECAVNRLLIGETKNATELGLSLVFANGYKKIINESDILFDAFDFTNRAWSNQNGLVKNRTTVMAVKKGMIVLDYVCKLDNTITGTFKIVCSAYTQEEYENLSAGLGILAIDIVLLIAISFSIFVPFKNNYALIAILFGICTLYLVILLLLYKATIYFIVSGVIISLSFIIISILRLVLKEKFPLPFLEDPLDFTPILDESFYQWKEVTI